jgi:outer membrane cobalamin receptor
MSEFFRAYNGLTEADKASILFYRNRKVFKSDIEFSYKKFAFGYSANYYSTFDKIDPRLYDLVQTFNDKAGAGVWIQNVRFSFQIDQHVTVAFLVNNIDNIEYSTRPGRMDPPRNFNVQFRMKF